MYIYGRYSIKPCLTTGYWNIYKSKTSFTFYQLATVKETFTEALEFVHTASQFQFWEDAYFSAAEIVKLKELEKQRTGKKPKT